MRLIDADLLREHLFVTESRTGGSRDEQAYEQGWDNALKAVMVYEPTVVDAVEVVRCKDCKHYVLYELFGRSQGWCERLCDEFDKSLARATEEDDFCSRGERREP